MSDLLYKIAINKIPTIGAIRAKTLISYCGSVEAVFHASRKELCKIPGISSKIANEILSSSTFDEAEAEMKFIEDHAIKPLFYLDENYPQRLRHFQDSPVMLFQKGEYNLNAPRNIAIVGTRKPTFIGVENAEKLVEELKPYNVNIISGLAYGIDVTAHRKSLEMNMPTIGVLGHGLQMIYPHAHRKIAIEMIQKEGGLLTEYCSDAQPDKQHFPMRNRIVAGLCDALIVVETAERGGSIISAEFANSYNKDVFAFPGRLNDKYSKGCNRLIKQHKANLIESVQDIAYILRWEINETVKEPQTKLFEQLSKEEAKLLTHFENVDSISIDKLKNDSSIPSSQLAGFLLNLELKGVLKPIPGNRYRLV